MVVFFTPIQIFLPKFPIWKTKNFISELILQKHCKHFEKLDQTL